MSEHSPSTVSDEEDAVQKEVSSELIAEAVDNAVVKVSGTETMPESNTKEPTSLEQKIKSIIEDAASKAIKVVEKRKLREFYASSRDLPLCTGDTDTESQPSTPPRTPQGHGRDR